MRSVTIACLCLALAVILFQDVNAQRFANSPNYPYREYRRPTVLVSRSGSVRKFTPSPISDEGDDNPGQDAKKVRLDIYYETECPDSRRFITRQLFPLYQEMGNKLDIHLVPFGKAEEYYDEKKGYTFDCHHGPTECYGNTVQTCAISLYPEKDYLNFINCMEEYANPYSKGGRCARRLSLDWDKIKKCADSDEGNRLLHEMAQKTKGLNPQLYFVPWVVVDGVFSETNQRMAQRNLRGVVCNALKKNNQKCGQ